MPRRLLHIISESEWAAARSAGRVEPDSLRTDGFIHLSDGEQVLRPANLLYRGRHDLVLLVVDTDRLTAPVVYEPGSHGERERFPHLYGPLDTSAVVDVVPFPCRPDGGFELPRLDDE